MAGRLQRVMLTVPLILLASTAPADSVAASAFWRGLAEGWAEGEQLNRENRRRNEAMRMEQERLQMERERHELYLQQQRLELDRRRAEMARQTDQQRLQLDPRPKAHQEQAPPIQDDVYKAWRPRSSSGAWQALQVGMSPEAVRDLLGEPEFIVEGFTERYWYWNRPHGGRATFLKSPEALQRWTEPAQ